MTVEEDKSCASITLGESLCPLCNSKAAEYSISPTNLQFLKEMNSAGNIDDSITLARIVWNNFPQLRLSADSKALIDKLLLSVQQEVKTILSPVDLITKTVNPLIQRLAELTDKLPENIKEEFADVNNELTQKMKTIEDAATKATDPVQKQVKDLSDAINQLVNKPNAKGKAGENMLGDCWQESFLKDKVEVLGGPGQSDIIIVPYLTDSQKYGERIVVERKTGKQKYNGHHLEKTISHAKSENSKYAVVVYDNPNNLSESQRPFFITTIDDTVVAITDAETGGWRTARQVFEVFQTISADKDSPKKEIDIAEILKTIEEMQKINTIIEQLRRHNNSAISCSESVREDIAKLENTILNYCHKLKELLSHKQAV